MKPEQDTALRDAGQTDGRKEPNARWWVKLLLFLHVACITLWALPKAPPGVTNGTVKPTGSDVLLHWNDIYIKPSPVETYLLATGLWQSWDMFSPNPASEDMWSDALVTLKDGTVVRYQYPRIYDLPIFTKYLKERYRKYFEHANTDQMTWPDFAQRVAFLVYRDTKDPNNPPVKVTLRRHFYFIPKIMPFDVYCKQLLDSIKSRNVKYENVIIPNPKIPDYSTEEYYEYLVDEKKLKEDG